MTRTKDVKSVKNIAKFQLIDVDPNNPQGDDLTADYTQLLSLVFGVGAIMTQKPFFALQSLVFCVVALANARTLEVDFKQIFSSVSVAIMSIMMTYSNEVNAWRAQRALDSKEI
jgi:PAT complex subunit Asterix